MSDQANDQRTAAHDTTAAPFDAIKHEDADGAASAGDITPRDFATFQDHGAPATLPPGKV